MFLKSRIVDVTPENLSENPGAICFLNPKNEYFDLKIKWLKEQFLNGLKIKLLYVEGEKKPKGFIEYVPGEFCWRSVDARGYIFIHCLWIYGKEYLHQGLGGKLIKEAEKDASGINGVAVMTSNGSFMMRKEIFLKYGYNLVAESGKDQLLVKPFREAPLPSFRGSIKSITDHKGLAIKYSLQCPWVARFIEEVREDIEKLKLDPEIIEFKTHSEAQNSPSNYGVFNMTWNDRLLADRYISTTRFKNIIRKEMH